MSKDKERLLFDRAWRLLASGQYVEGFGLWEKVRFSRGSSPTAKPKLSFPEWTGEPVSSLLVLPEQGLGDQIQFVRFVPELVGRGIAVTLYAHPALVPLLGGLGATVRPVAGKAGVARHDAWIMLGSLPHRLGLTLEAISGEPYLAPPPGRLEAWPTKLRYGVVWRGNPAHANDRHRSMSAADAERLLSLPGAVSLHPEDTKARDMADTAAIIEKLEAVITVDTSVAHLAGAMGKRTLLMLPARLPDWRWLQDRTDSPWYSSIEILRQPPPGDWGGVIENAIGSL